MNKILLSLFLSIVLTVSPVSAEDRILLDRTQQPNVKTLNGNVWMKLSDEGKDMFISGVATSRFLIERRYDKAGVQLVLTDAVSELKNETAVYDINSSIKTIVSYIDKFYADIDNMNIPLFEVYELMCYWYKGIVTAEQITDKTKFLRDMYK